MEKTLYTPTLAEIADEINAVATVLLTRPGVGDDFELYKKLSAATLKLASIQGAIRFFENFHGSLGQMSEQSKEFIPQPVPGLGAITLPEGVTLEAFADIILPKCEPGETGLCSACKEWVPLDPNEPRRLSRHASSEAFWCGGSLEPLKCPVCNQNFAVIEGRFGEHIDAFLGTRCVRSGATYTPQWRDRL